MLRRFADYRLRAELARTRDSRDRYRRVALTLASSLKAARQANVSLARDLAAAQQRENTP